MVFPRSFGAYGFAVMLAGCAIPANAAPVGLAAMAATAHQPAVRLHPPDPPPTTTVVVVSNDSVSVDCAALINAARASAGFAQLATDARLTAAASAHSADQAARNTMTHTGADGSTFGQRVTRQGYVWSRVGENVAFGQSDCSAVVTAWLGSAAHRANILGSAFKNIGVAAAADANGRLYWTMDFATPG